MGETCDICGRDKEDCGACGDWSMGGEAYEYERAQLKCYSIGFTRLRDLYREWQEEVDRARAALRERDAAWAKACASFWRCHRCEWTGAGAMHTDPGCDWCDPLRALLEEAGK